MDLLAVAVVHEQDSHRRARRKLFELLRQHGPVSHFDLLLRERFAALRKKFPNRGAAFNRNKCLALAHPLPYAFLRGVH